MAGREEEGQKVTDTKKMREIRQQTRLRSGYERKPSRRKGRSNIEMLKSRRGFWGESTNWKLMEM